MNGFPFQAPIWTQVHTLADNLDLLRCFAREHPHVKPWAISALNASAMFASTQAHECRTAFGPDAWTVEGLYAIKEVMGIRVELRLAKTEPQQQQNTVSI